VNEKEDDMTGKSEFTEDEWQLVLEGPPVAGMLVLTAHGGGSFRESFALAKAYTEARKQQGESELLDEIVSTKPAFDRGRYGSPDKLRGEGLQRLRDAVGVLETKATPPEVDAYRGFVLGLAKRVATAHEEEGQKVSPAEQEAIEAITASLGAPSA
jgi:hypothetical protein